jgi:protein-disulfide isomerase
MGRDDEGHQWIGAAEPKLVVQEFTDFECPYCRRAHMRLRALMARNPTYLRAVHRNFPLDQACNRSITAPFHARACMLAKVAHCAGEQGRFWEMNDYLFQHAAVIKESQLTVEQLGRQLELDVDRLRCCADARETDEHIKRDIEAGIGLALEGTPSYLIDGKVSVGGLPDEVVAKILAE